MKNVMKKTTVAALTVVTIASAATFGAVNNAEAGGKKFWRGVAAGAIGAAVIHHATRPRYVAPAPVYVAPAGGNWNAHVSWCYNRYNSYSHHDNRFTTFRGYRKTCRSPYL